MGRPNRLVPVLPSDEVAPVPPSDEKAASRQWQSQEHGPAKPTVPEVGGPKGPEPTRYGDWEKGGRCIDF